MKTILLAALWTICFFSTSRGFAQEPPSAVVPEEPAEAAFVLSRREEAPAFPASQKRTLKPGFSSVGTWTASGTFKTPLGNSRWSNQAGIARWNPLLTTPGLYRVSAYKIVSGKKDDPEIAFTINHSGKKSSASLDSTQGASEWVVLGEYDFSADRDEFVEYVPSGSAQGNIYTRISDVRFDRIDASGKIEDSLIVTVEPWLPRYLNVAGIKEHPARQEITTLVRKGFATLLPDGTFAPDEPISSSDFLAWAMATASDEKPSTQDKTLAKAKELGIPQAEELLKSNGITGKQAAKLLAQIAQAKGRSLAARHGAPATASEVEICESIGILPKAPPQNQGFWSRLKMRLGFVGEAAEKNLTRAEAAVALRRFLHLVLAPNPPPGGDWQLVFEDRFDKPAVDESVWTIDNSVRVPNRLGRWRENVEVKDGHIRLLNKVESRNGCVWSSGNLQTKGEWQYGYFEASYRYARAVGINNAFWGFSKNSDNPQVELNPNEGWYPDIINAHFYIHHKKDRKVTHLTNGTADGTLLGYRAGENLADDFHVYGMEWNEKELIFYFDGREIRRLPNIDCHRPIAVWFSTYIGDWCGGKATRAVDGTAMEVDWVRVWQKKPERR
ncbi:MAG: family 16 glycosylhydrolase [Opitutus sp.]|nr:family 16 glycosylhydrolase [Opitutus sp.]MCS6247476.1 family 16 glycosylhydrolase [Opitutus sp.]MCS6274148.1 family 16 glycosylhydrolase [Opitutus sp.]MCS6277057.1 family 16 glycosylhydrolase [Opitutus sp.]MCS6300179.1 family 16 glycosylhydrolase [Opitutus sp.]